MNPSGFLLFLVVDYASSFSLYSYAYESKLVAPPDEARKGPPVQPTKPPGNCLPEEFAMLRSCYANYLAKYYYIIGNETLPHKSAKPFDRILDQQSTICSNYKPFLSCENSVPLHCITFESLQKLAGDESDALYYLQNLAYIELYCDYSKQFIRYSQCLELIDQNELQELVYEECELNIHDDCLAVQKTVKCEKGVVTMVCDSKQSIDAYCTYQNLQMRRAAWNYCVDMPCSSRSWQFVELIFILIWECL